jgi:predicted RNA binding protein YcfA (HicA-like mRNA interferase family)
MPKIPTVKVSDFIRFVELYLGFEYVKTKNGHERYEHPTDESMSRIEFSCHGKTKKELPGVYVLSMLRPFNIGWKDFCKIIKKL